jgi:hypothetical protein
MNKPQSLKFSNKNAQKPKPPTLTMETELSESTIHATLKDSQFKSSVRLTPIPKIKTEPMPDYAFSSVLSPLPVQTIGLLDWTQKTIATQLSVLPTTKIFGFFIESPKCLTLFSKQSTLTSKKMVSMLQA